MRRCRGGVPGAGVRRKTEKTVGGARGGGMEEQGEGLPPVQLPDGSYAVGPGWQELLARLVCIGICAALPPAMRSPASRRSSVRCGSGWRLRASAPR